MGRSIGIILCLALLCSIGCGGEKTDELALAKEEFEASLYSKAEVRLEEFVKEQPQNVEAQCLLGVIYSRQDKAQKLETAAVKLRSIGKPAADNLVNMMKYELNLAEDAAEVLVAIGESAVDALIPVLGDATERVRESAVSILTKIGTPAAAPLMKALESPDVLTRAGTARALGNIGNVAAIEPLKKGLADESPHVKIEVAAALYKLGDKSQRSEERRVGKECRSRWSPYH